MSSALTETLLALARGDERAVLFTVVAGDREVGRKLLVLSDRGELVGDDTLGLGALAPGLRRNTLLEHDGLKVFAEVFGPPPRLVVVGAVDTAEALCAAAKAVAGTRSASMRASSTRSPRGCRAPTRSSSSGPSLRSPRSALDRDTAVVVLTHDDKFDIPALATALRTEAFYVGALGSRRAQAKRRERLLEIGVSEEQLTRLRGPAGLDIGAESPAETAVSILAEILAMRAGRLGGPLRESTTRIHVER